MRRILRSVLLVAFLLATAGSAARAQSVGRLFFLHSDTGANMIGGVSELGRFHVLASGTQTALVFQPVWAVTGDGILCYNYGGGGSIVQLDGTALPRFFTGFGFSSGWDQIAGIGNYLFFLRNSIHTGVVVAVNPDGSTTQTDTRTDLSTWTNLIPTDNYLVFYNSSNGALAAGVISNVQKFFQTSSSSTIVDAARFGTVGDDVLFYDFTTGNYNIQHVLYNGARTDPFSFGASGVLGKNYTFINHLNRSLLFYNPTTGGTLIGTIDQSGTNAAAWKQTQAGVLLKGWSAIVTAGQFLVFYNKTTGALSVGFISTAGTWVQTDYQANVGAGYNSVAATAR